jgi:HEAT repeat protein
VREETANALAKIGVPATEPLIANLAAYWVVEQQWDKCIEIGTPAVESLIAALEDKDWHVRQATVRALGRIGDARAVEPLIARQSDTSKKVREEAANALAKIGVSAIEPLIANLKNIDMRQATSKVLAQIGTPVIEPLIPTLKDRDDDVRWTATKLLGQIGPQLADAALRTRTAELLIDGLKDKDKYVCLDAAKALGQIGPQLEDVALLAQMEKSLITALEERDEDVCQAAVKALGRIGVSAVKSRIAALKDEDKDVRLGAVKALGKIGGARAVKPLSVALKDEDKHVRQAAAKALGEIGDTRAVEPLMKKKTVLEKNLTISMIDFFKEAEYIIKLGLASSKRDINTINWYRIIAKNKSVIKPKNSLLLRNARIICDGKIYGLCEGTVKVTNPLQPSPDGHLLLQMNGPLDAPSKCSVSCSCGTSFIVYADATVGEPKECYLRIDTVHQAAGAKLPIRPFFETDGIDIVRF